jgi:hypothetical protein
MITVKRSKRRVEIVRTGARPSAGGMLLLRIESGVSGVQVFAGGHLVLKHECPDPPCHEKVALPAEAADSPLVIAATDSLRGRRWAESFKVRKRVLIE